MVYVFVLLRFARHLPVLGELDSIQYRRETIFDAVVENLIDS